MRCFRNKYGNFGLPSWTDIQKNMIARPSVHFTCTCSSAMVDQISVYSKQLVTWETKDNYAVLILDGDCHCHISHLITKDHLRLSDGFMENHFKIPYRLFSSLAKLVHVWRDNVALMRKCLEVDHGVEAAVQYGMRLPPRCLAGRWGSIWETVVFLHAEGQGRHIFSRSFISMIKPGLNQEKERRKDAGGMDKLTLEELQSYRERLGRWKGDAMEVVACDVLWSILAVNDKVSVSLTHYLHMASTSERDNDVLQTDGSLLSRLNGGEACKLIDQCADRLRTSDAWLPQVLVDAQLSDEHVRTLRSYAVSLSHVS